uniref:C-type lectin domain-containing protein n=1 Tax=Romanomermis culicivorax TaxID=13658 RepID=A0A915KQB1_ROMCU
KGIGTVLKQSGARILLVYHFYDASRHSDQCSTNINGQSYAVFRLSNPMDSENRAQWSTCTNSNGKPLWGWNDNLNKSNDCIEMMDDLAKQNLRSNVEAFFNHEDNTCDFERLYKGKQLILGSKMLSNKRLTLSLPCSIGANGKKILFKVGKENSTYYCDEDGPIFAGTTLERCRSGEHRFIRLDEANEGVATYSFCRAENNSVDIEDNFDSKLQCDNKDFYAVYNVEAGKAKICVGETMISF